MQFISLFQYVNVRFTFFLVYVTNTFYILNRHTTNAPLLCTKTAFMSPAMSIFLYSYVRVNVIKNCCAYMCICITYTYFAAKVQKIIETTKYISHIFSKIFVLQPKRANFVHIAQLPSIFPHTNI